MSAPTGATSLDPPHVRRIDRAPAAALARHRRRRARLLPLGEALDPHAALLSPRDSVLENGMPRFFRRLREGVFDEDDLRARVDELGGFLSTAGEHHGVAPGSWWAVGFSNGANIASATLLRRPEVLAGAVLFAAMVPFADPPDS